MRLTTKGRYAVTALLDLVLHADESPFSLAAISARQNIPQPYLERLAGQLRAKGLLVSVRGPGGGYLLGRSPDKISIAEVIDAVEDSMDATRCQGQGGCQAGLQCLTHHLWDELNTVIDDFLSTVTLASLAKRQATQSISARQDEAHDLLRS